MDFASTHIPTFVVTIFFAVLSWLAKGRIERMEKDMQDIRKEIQGMKDDVVWKDTCVAYHNGVDKQLERIEQAVQTIQTHLLGK
jgi:hypothetical protein